jgi:hypothetical protein
VDPEVFVPDPAFQEVLDEELYTKHVYEIVARNIHLY